MINLEVLEYLHNVQSLNVENIPNELHQKLDRLSWVA